MKSEASSVDATDNEDEISDDDDDYDAAYDD